MVARSCVVWFCFSSAARAASAGAHKEGQSVTPVGGPCAELGLPPLPTLGPALHCGLQVKCRVYGGLRPAYVSIPSLTGTWALEGQPSHSDARWLRAWRPHTEEEGRPAMFSNVKAAVQAVRQQDLLVPPALRCCLSSQVPPPPPPPRGSLKGQVQTGVLGTL